MKGFMQITLEYNNSDNKGSQSAIFVRTLVRTRVKGTDDKVRFIYHTALATM